MLSAAAAAPKGHYSSERRAHTGIKLESTPEGVSLRLLVQSNR
jgi:hypothetical protein